MSIPVLLLAACLLLFTGTANASWLIDETRFHVSAHGQTSCQDCHEDIPSPDRHPDPASVNKKLPDFFRPDQCLSCHDDVMDNLAEGLHGDKKIKDQKEYAACLGCHNPHYQPRLGDNRIEKFDPSSPLHRQCGLCHEKRSALPAPSPGDGTCMACHRSVDPEDPRKAQIIAGFCFHCHGEKTAAFPEKVKSGIPLINESHYVSTPHAKVACTLCHAQAARFGHGSQGPGDCRQCHSLHDEKVSHDAHADVACGACHLEDIRPVRNHESKLVLWERLSRPGAVSRIHRMKSGGGETSCETCHFKDNQVGAVSMILPAKSIMCMPCHTATFSVGDTTTVLALIVFLAGFMMIFSYWLSGTNPGEKDGGPIGRLFNLLLNGIRTIFSSKILLIIKAMILDVLLQRRLFRQSGVRWLIHSLIFLPFVFRFSWGIAALAGSLWTPKWQPVWAMLDKNHPATAFLFDITGIMVLLGVVLAIIRAYVVHPSRPPGLPGQDRVALGLIGGVILVGFVLEGMRIAMTGTPEGSEYAVLGYVISTLFSNPGKLVNVYGYIWYLHAILTGMFVAYLPFSRMVHIIMAPVVLAMNAVMESERERKPWTKK